MTIVSASRPCLYCGAGFDPMGNDAKLYCSREHQKHAAGRRRRDRARAPERSLVCPWCGAGFTTRLDNQVYCAAAHRLLAAACARTRGFLALPAAEDAIAETPGRAEPYRCPGAGTPHWHLRSVRS